MPPFWHGDDAHSLVSVKNIPTHCTLCSVSIFAKQVKCVIILLLNANDVHVANNVRKVKQWKEIMFTVFPTYFTHRPIVTGPTNANKTARLVFQARSVILTRYRGAFIDI